MGVQHCPVKMTQTHTALLLTILCTGSQSAVVRRSADCPILPSYPGTRLQNISALGIAVLLDSTDDISGLIESGCDPNYAGAFLPTTTDKCSNPFLERIGVNCTRKINVPGYTPLIIATITGSTNAVKELAAAPGIDLDFNHEALGPAIYASASEGNLDIVKALSEAGAFLDNPGGPNNLSPLMVAIGMGHNDVTNYLLSQNVDVNFIGPGNSRTPSYIAAEGGNLHVLKTLKKNGANLDIRVGNNQATPLIIASQNGHLKTVEYLINQRVDLNTQGEAGDSAILQAARNGHLDVVKSLRRAGANPNLLLTTGHTPLSIAILNGHTDIALFLIRNGADLTLDTPVFDAAHKGNILVLEALSQANAK